MKKDMKPTTHTPTTIWSSLGLALICFVASFLGSWIFINSGLVRVDSTRTITTNRQSIVSQEGEVMEGIAKKVSPSVVSIITQGVTQSLYGTRATEGAGTGIIISSDGYVLTNKHVVGNARNVQIVGHDGTVYEDVSVVGTDPLNDVAFLKIKNATNLTPATLGDSSDVQVGEKVVAIGNALGEFQNSVTSGIISGRGRPIIAQGEANNASGEQLDNLFQTDAAINPGNSGGPLLDLNGNVIGINTAVAEDAQGIGFAIPINATKGIIKNLKDTGKVERAYLGVKYISLSPSVAKSYKLSVSQGAFITDEQQSAVLEDGPAAKAGIEDGDIVTKVNNVKIDQNNGMALLLAEYVPGDKVTLTIDREGETKTIAVTLGTYNGN
jgi:serine protease Do